MSEGIRILLVDASGALRLLSHILRANGFVPSFARSAEEALRMAVLDRPDVLVVEDQLPGESGGELIRRVRASDVERLRTVPVVALSSRLDAAARLVACGATSFRAKPFHDAELLEVIRGVLAPVRAP
jgi:DNA-binding response OmpR family regulator